MRRLGILASMFAWFGLFAGIAFANIGPVKWSANGHWYELQQVWGLSWEDARDYATGLTYDGMAGHLATITSAEEATFVFWALGGPHRYKSWIGGFQWPRDTPNPGANWYWVTGEPWSYTNWSPNAPNDAEGGEFFLDLYWDSAAQNWNDAGFQDNIESFVVEYDSPIAPPPPSGGLLWVPNFGSNDVTVVDTDTREVIATIPVAGGPAGVAVGSDYVYITCRRSSHLYKLSVAALAVADSIDLSPVMAFPIAAALDSSGYVYVAGRAQEYAPAIDDAIVAKLSPAGQIVASRVLHFIQADAYPVDPFYSMRAIGIGVSRTGFIYLPWFCSWINGTGYDVLQPSDLQGEVHDINPYLHGYFGPGVATDFQGHAWFSSVRQGMGRLFRVDPGASVIRDNSCGVGGYLTGDLVAAPWGAVAFGSDSPSAKLSVYSDEELLCMRDLPTGAAGMSLDGRGRLWVAYPYENRLRCYTAMAQAEVGSVSVGLMPLGYGDMTGSESVFIPAPDVGACCHGADCIILREDLCVNSLGLFLGAEQTCDPNPCAPTGAPTNDRSESPQIYWDVRAEQGVAVFGYHGGPTTARLQVFDLQGRRVFQMAEPIGAGGDQRLAWSGRLADGDRAPSGVYFVRVRVGGIEFAGRFVVLR